MFSMKNHEPSEIVITGIGITSAIGQGKTDFVSALMSGRHQFGVMQRPGRQNGTSFLGAEISSLSIPERLSKRLLRTGSFSGQVAMVTLHEAWDEAKLDAVDPHFANEGVTTSSHKKSGEPHRDLLQLGAGSIRSARH